MRCTRILLYFFLSILPFDSVFIIILFSVSIPKRGGHIVVNLNPLFDRKNFRSKLIYSRRKARTMNRKHIHCAQFVHTFDDICKADCVDVNKTQFFFFTRNRTKSLVEQKYAQDFSRSLEKRNFRRENSRDLLFYAESDDN